MRSCEIKEIVDPESRRTPLSPLELSQKFNSYIDTWEIYYASTSYQTVPSNQLLPPHILSTTAADCNTAERSIAGGLAPVVQTVDSVIHLLNNWGLEIKPLDRKKFTRFHVTSLTSSKYVWILFSPNKGIFAEMSNVSDRRRPKLP